MSFLLLEQWTSHSCFLLLDTIKAGLKIKLMLPVPSQVLYVTSSMQGWCAGICAEEVEWPLAASQWQRIWTQNNQTTVSHCSSWQLPDAAVSDSRCVLQNLWLLRASMHWEDESYILFQGCMWHHCLSPLGLRGGDEIGSIQKYTQRAKPFTCPSSNSALSRAHRCAQLCSWPGHKGLSLYIACKTISFLMHNYFQGPLSPTVEDGSGRHADPKGP